MDLTSFRTLGRSGLVVSPFALGTMTFGAGRWGTEEDGARAILDAYAEAGGNFVDTADNYGSGRSEEMLGRWSGERGSRDRLVIATKFTWNLDRSNPNAGGNGRKNVMRAIDTSLRRLGTDYIDLYWSHFRDMTTPVEELLQTLVDLVHSGKIRYYALSDVPAWYATKMAVLAAERGLPGPVAIQAEYSLVERTAEREHVPVASECKMGLVPWSPLAGGFLTGKYKRAGKRESSDRLNGGIPLDSSKFGHCNWVILDALEEVAAEIGCPPARTALAWTIARPRVDALLLGASRPQQARDNVAVLTLDLSKNQRASLDAASALKPALPYSGFGDDVKRSIFGGTDVAGWPGGLGRCARSRSVGPRRAYRCSRCRTARTASPADGATLARSRDGGGLEPGCAARSHEGAVRVMAARLRRAPLRDDAERAARRVPPHSLARTRRAADDHDPWLAWFGGRVQPRGRSAHQSGRARRRRAPPLDAILKAEPGERLGPGADDCPDMFAEEGLLECPFAPRGALRRLSGRQAIGGCCERLAAVQGSGGMVLTASYPVEDGHHALLEHEGMVGNERDDGTYRQLHLAMVQVGDGRVTLFREYRDTLPLVAAFGPQGPLPVQWI